MCAWAFCLPSGQGKGQTNTHVAPLPALPRFRVLCQTVIAHKLFDYVVLAFIFLNCITIALERPQIEAGSTVSGWGLQAVQGTRQRNRLPRLAVGWHAGLGLESSMRPDATEGGVPGAGLWKGAASMDCEVAASPGCPLAEGRGWQFWELLDPRPLPALSGTHLPHCVQLHLHSYLRGRDDPEGTGFTWDLTFPLSGPQALVQPLSAGHPLAPQQHSTGGIGGPSPLGASHWVGLLGRRKDEGAKVSFMSAGRVLIMHFQCHGGTCWRPGGTGVGSV